MTKYIILGLLKIRDLTAYDVKLAIEKSISFFHSSSLGSINPTLKKLEKEGLVTCHETIENHRAKKIYTITDEGNKVYTSWLQAPIFAGRIKDEMLIRLFFMGDNDSNTRTKLIEDYISEINNTREALQQLKQISSNKDIPEELAQTAKFQLATLDFGIDYYEFTANWFTKLLNHETN